MRFSIVWSDSRMDGREQLRRYLEQRKESGERELVLDQMNVDEVLRLVGAGPVRTSASPSPASAAPHARPPAPPPTEQPGSLPSDWREVLRNTGASPETGTQRPADREAPAPRDAVSREAVPAAPVHAPPGLV